LLILINSLVAAILVAVLLALGARIRYLVRLPLKHSLRLPVELSLGAWAAATVLLLQALAGLVSAPWLAATVVLLAACGCWRRNRRRWTGFGVAAIGGLLPLTVAIGPPIFYDAMVYHLGLPWQVLCEAGLHAHPENVFAAFPPLSQLLALPFLAWGLDRAPALLHWLTWLAASCAVQELARRSGAPVKTRYLLGAAVLLLPVAPIVAGFPAAEGWFLMPQLTAISLLLGRPAPGTAAAAGLLAGVATAARLQGLPWTLPLLVMVAWRTRSLRQTSLAAGCWFLGALPWWLKNLLLLGDPLAPLLWQREGLETLWRDSGSYLKAGHGLVASLAQLPDLLSSELVYLLPMIALAAVAARRPGAARAVAALALAGLLIWPLSGALLRFLTPTLVLLAAAVSSLGQTKVRRMAAMVVLLGCGLVGVARSVGQLQLLRPLSLLPLSREVAASQVLANDPQLAFDKARALPPDALVLMVAEPRGFGFPRPFVTPSQHDPSLLRPALAASRNAEEAVASLRDQGFTHILVNWRELERLKDGYPVAPWFDSETRLRWSQLLVHIGSPMIAHGGVSIYSLPTVDCDG
jgi:hypothetical protein